MIIVCACLAGLISGFLFGRARIRAAQRAEKGTYSQEMVNNDQKDIANGTRLHLK